MKLEVTNPGLFARLGVMAAALLLSQHVLAAGTDAGITVSNQATVAYDVNTEPQTPIESDPLGNSTPGAGDPTEFLVDRRVDFTIAEIGSAHTDVQPGDQNAFTTFELTNNGNAIMDFRLSLVDLTSADGPVHGEDDTDDLMSNYEIWVANGQGAGGIPTSGDLGYVDELVEDEVVVIYVVADAGATLPNDAYDNFTLVATAADEADAAATPLALDPDLAESPGADDPTIIESVFADNGNDGFESADDGFHVNSAELVITKTAAVISDPFGSGKALPDAVIEYTVTIDNTNGTAVAENIVLTDTIQIANVDLEDEAYGFEDDVAIDAAFCNADLGDGDGDGCSYDSTTGDLSVDVPDIAAGASSTVTYQVRVSPL